MVLRRRGMGVGLMLRRMSHIRRSGSKFSNDASVSNHVCPQIPTASITVLKLRPASVSRYSNILGSGRSRARVDEHFFATCAHSTCVSPPSSAHRRTWTNTGAQPLSLPPRCPEEAKMKTIPTHTKLTDTFTAALPPAEPGKRYLVTDTLVHGLAVSVTDRGSKSYVLVARFGSNNPTRRLIGKVGKIGLARAREIAREWHALIARGKDPAAEIAHQEAAERVLKANTFEAVAMDFIRLMVVGPGYGRAQEEAGGVLAGNPAVSPLYALAQVIKDHPPADLKRRSAHVAIRNIDRELLPRLGGKPIASITPRDIVVIFDKAVERGAEPMAHNLYSLVRRVVRWAVSKNVYGADSPPLENMRPADVIGTKQPRTRWLQHDVEIRTVWRATAALGYPYAQAYRLLMLTGLRRSEIAGARWSEIDLRARLWTVPGSRMKTGHDHEIPLTADMLELLREVPRWAGSDDVFSGTAGDKPING